MASTALARVAWLLLIHFIAKDQPHKIKKDHLRINKALAAYFGYRAISMVRLFNRAITAFTLRNARCCAGIWLQNNVF